MIKSLDEVASGITRFEKTMKAHKDAGGTPPTGQEIKNDFMDTLPSLLREDLSHRFTLVPNESFGSFVGFVRTTAQSMLFHDGKYAINSLEDRHEPAAPEWETHEQGSYEAEIMAVNR